MTFAIGVAIAKPWERSVALPGPAASEAAIVAADPSPTRPPVRSARPESSPPDWTDVAGAAAPHEGWGVSAIVVVRRASSGIPVSPLAPRYLERWSPSEDDSSGNATVYLNHDDRSIAALGVTVPDGVRASAVWVWRLHADDELEWIDATRIDDEAAIGAPLLVRVPLADEGAARPWDAGRYRVDVLTRDGIHRISVLIPNRFGNVPRPDEWTATLTDVIAARASNPSVIRIGLFATVNGSAVPIAARQSEPLGESEAWRATADEGDPTVAARHLPHATGLGVMLTQHAFVRSATIRRLAPEPLVDAPEPYGGISDIHGSTPFVVFEAPHGTAWPPGVYAITVGWDDPTGSHNATWHVELRPGPA